MRVYATEAEAWPSAGSTPAPANADSLLTFASLLVDDATKTAHYPTDTEGFPTGDLRGLFRDATVAQAKFWSSHSIDPEAGPVGVQGGQQATGKSIGTAQINYSVSLVEAGVHAKVDSLTELCPLAHRILSDWVNQPPVRR